MVGPSSQHSDVIQAFHVWRQSSEARLSGIGGPDLETPCWFIPRSRLKDYFADLGQLEQLLDAVGLDSNERTALDANYVRKYYLQTFATLLCIGEGGMIHYFQQYKSLRDEALPYHQRPPNFPFMNPDMFPPFTNEQWQFCAPNLDYCMSETFREENILPIIRKEKIGEGGSAIVHKIVIDGSHNSLVPSGHSIPDFRRKYKNTFVLKTYRAVEAKENWKAERNAFLNLKMMGVPSPHIIAYYGSFIHGGLHNIILEYADQGTLEDFMKNTDSPTTIEETLLLWDRLSDITSGVMTIHGKVGTIGSASRYLNPRTLNGWHQDIKPANILVSSGNGASPFDRHFKIADLGLAHFKPSDPLEQDPLDLDVFGTRAYGAPETFRSHPDTSSASLQVTPAVDIWSIGCIFSEVSVWAHYGWKRVNEYRRQRSEEIKAKYGDDGEYLFHFDGKLLKVVEDIHRDILSRAQAKDHTTRSILGDLVKDMLQPGSRLEAKFIFEKSKRIIKEESSQFEVSLSGLMGRAQSSTGDARDLSDPSKGESSGSPTVEEYLAKQPLPPDEDLTQPSPFLRAQTSPETYSCKPTNRKDKHRSTNATKTSQAGEESLPAVSNQQSTAQVAPHAIHNSSSQSSHQFQEEPQRPFLSIDEGHNWKKKKKEGGLAILPGRENLPHLQERDHIFLVDNSETMRVYKPNIEKVVSLLAYILKPSDSDGLDIYFTQSLKKINSQRSSNLSSSINQVPFLGCSDMRGRLHEILEEHIPAFDTPIKPPKLLRSLFKRQTTPQRPKPLSFYILTDAKWQPTDVGGRIKDLVRSMSEKHLPKEHVGIQFIRFGDDQASIAKLDELDHGLGLKDRNMDIVDHTSWDGNVWKMLIGALNDWYDDDPP